MKKFILALIFTFFSVSGFSQNSKQSFSQESFQAINSSVVSIVTTVSGDKKYLGPGFVVSESGLIVTNYNTVKEAKNISIEFKGGLIYPISGVVYYNIKADLFLLKTKASGLFSVDLAETFSLDTGDPIYYLKILPDTEAKLNSGIFSGVKDYQNLKWFQFTIPESSATIGSPILNSKGKAIGIITTLAEGCQKLNLGVSLEQIKPYLGKEPVISFTEFKKLEAKADSYLADAKDNYANKQYQRAIKLSEKILALRPNSLEAYNLLGLSYYQIKNYKKAIENYKKAIEVNSKFIPAYSNLAVVYLQRGQPQEAIASYKEILNINSESLQTWYKLGRTYIDLDEYQKAIACYKRVLEINPKAISVFDDLGWVYDVLGDYQKSIEYFEKYAKYNSNDPEIYFKLGLVYFEAKNNLKAKEKLLTAKKLATEQGRKQLMKGIEEVLKRIGE
ncbi:MAG: tetratricopeptide repeat protein [Candidatus Omnitrophica bacterium]|nr:tetratricopeptide repeat protein [Candidatus Omnitrophota bacterium]